MVNIWHRKKLNVRTYEPKKKLMPRKEETWHWFGYIGTKFMALSGFLTFFVSSIFMSIKTFFTAKSKFREIQMRHERVLDLSNKRKTNVNAG